MKKFKVQLKGVTPYMQHRMDDQSLEDWEKMRGKIIERPEVGLEDLKRADFHCFRDFDNMKCYLPSEHIRGSLINAGAFMKAKVGNSRKSMKNIVAAMFDVVPEKIYLPEFDEIDKRSAVNRNVKARIITVRPKWNNLDVEFTLMVDNDTITKKTVEELFEYAGKYVGIGSFRPTNNGKFGRYEIVKLEALN